MESFIHPDLLNLNMACPECRYKDKTDMLIGHLLETHRYDVSQAKALYDDWEIQYDWIDDVPYYQCAIHGLYPVKDTYCGGCGAEEAALDRALGKD